MLFRNGDVAWRRFAACLDQWPKQFAPFASRLSPGIFCQKGTVFVVVYYFSPTCAGTLRIRQTVRRACRQSSR